MVGLVTQRADPHVTDVRRLVSVASRTWIVDEGVSWITASAGLAVLTRASIDACLSEVLRINSWGPTQCRPDGVPWDDLSWPSAA